MNRLIKRTWILTLISTGVISSAYPGWTQLTEPTDTLKDPPILFNASPPRQGSPSGRRRGGASRGPCRRFESLTALVPAPEGVVWGQTVSDRPTFWFYLPDQLTSQTSVEFTVQDDTDNYVYQTRLTAPGTQPGLLQIAVPAAAKPLEVGKPYAWTLSVYCDPGKPSAAIFVKGTIQRVNLDRTLQTQLKAATPLEQVKLYATHGIWHEALHTLATLYQTNPTSQPMTTAWTNLLQQVDLANLSTQPFVSCCVAKD